MRFLTSGISAQSIFFKKKIDLKTLDSKIALKTKMKCNFDCKKSDNISINHVL